MNLVSLLIDNARIHPERLALVDSSGVVSYGELARRVSAGAAHLRQIGLTRGQVVLVFQPVSIKLYEILLSAFHAGLCVMLADPSAGRGFLSLCCQRLQPDAFFGSWKALCLRATVAEMRDIKISICSDAWFPFAKPWRTNSAGATLTSVSTDEAALVTFTSGSTGLPKAALRSHGFLLAQHRALSKALDYEDGEVDLITLPVFVLANLASGLTSVLAATNLAKPGTPDIDSIAAQCAEFGVTRCAASPAFFEGLMRSPARIPSFKKLYTGGAPVFPDLLRRLQQSLPEASIHAVYGSTEAEPIAHFPASHANDEIHRITLLGGGLCVGSPVADIELRIIRDQWGVPMTDVDLDQLVTARGQVGEIIVSGDHVLKGYLGGLGNEDTKIHAGGQVWHRTGDAGWLDSRNRLWLLGRCSAKLDPFPAADGLPIHALSYPFGIECAMREIFPEIRMAALTWDCCRTLVIGQKCDSATVDAVNCSAKNFGIDRMIYLESIPLDRRHNAKIDYPALRVALLDG